MLITPLILPWNFFIIDLYRYSIRLLREILSLKTNFITYCEIEYMCVNSGFAMGQIPLGM